MDWLKEFFYNATISKVQIKYFSILFLFKVYFRSYLLLFDKYFVSYLIIKKIRLIWNKANVLIVQTILIPTSLFLTNKKGYPVLSKTHQEHFLIQTFIWKNIFCS